MSYRPHKHKATIILLLLFFFSSTLHASLPRETTVPFAPGEKLKYALRWGNIPAGELNLEIHPIAEVNGAPSYHFVMTAKSNSTVDLFCKIRDRIDAFADIGMTRSVHYQKQENGSRGNRREEVVFDWAKGHAQFSDTSNTHAPIKLQPGSFDPLSAFYYTRMAISNDNPQIQRPVTNGKKSFMGNARVVGRESIILKNGKQYDTLILQPQMGLFGGVFKDSEGASLQVWVTADEKRIPVQIKAKVKVGHFIGELVSAEGV